MTFLYVVALIILLVPVKFLIFPVKRLGNKKNPSKKERLIIACNHFSIRDIFLIGAMFSDRQIYFFAKKELFKNKFVAKIFKWLGVIPVSRGEADFQAIKNVVKVLNRNKTIGIFPEGTRNKVSQEEMLSLKNGVALFSLKTDSKVLPVYMLNRPRMFRRNYVYVGEPFDFSDIPGDRVNKEKLTLATVKLTDKMTEVKEKLLDYAKTNKIKIIAPKQDEQETITVVEQVNKIADEVESR